MILPDGTELAWFLSGMWAALFILRAGRVSQSGFFAVVAMLVLAALPVLGLLFEPHLVDLGARIQAVFRANY